MTTPATAERKLKRRWFAPRFSLRMLLQLVTAAAIGSAIWWRWPVRQTISKGSQRAVMTFHRGWNGELIKHGLHSEYFDDELTLQETYREGVLHGPYLNRGVTGEYHAGKKHGTWHFLPRADEVHDLATATYDDPFGGPPQSKPKPIALPAREAYRAEEHWNRGKRDGLFQWWDHTGKLCFAHEFKNDKLLIPPNNPTQNLLLKRIADGALRDQKLENAILQRCDLNYRGVPLQEAVDDLRDRFQLQLAMRCTPRTVVLVPTPERKLPPLHEIPYSDDWILLEPDDLRASPQLVDMRPRSLAHPTPPQPVVRALYEVPVNLKLRNTPLYVGFDAMLSPLGLVLDYRFGVLCILDADGAEDWVDVTGVMKLRPAADTLLATRLDSPPKPTCLEPLRDVLRNLAAEQEIRVEFRPTDDPSSILDSIPKDEFVGLFREVLTIRNSPESRPTEPLPITLRHLLGLILDQANLRCHEENGVLIIERH